jgi:hypothetical protein
MIPTSSRRQSASTLTASVAVMQKLKNHALNSRLNHYRREIMLGNCEPESIFPLTLTQIFGIGLNMLKENPWMGANRTEMREDAGA